MANTPSTIFAGTTGPEGDRPGPNRIAGRAAMYLVLAIFFPVAVFIYIIWLILFTYARLPWWAPAPVAAVAGLIAIITGKLSPDGIHEVFSSIAKAISGILSKNGSVVSSIFHMVLTQSILSLFLATFFAAITIAWKWARAPRWQEKNLIPGPVLKRRLKENRMKIQVGIESPTEGITLGLSQDVRDPRFANGKPGAPYGDRVVITDDELSAHTLVVGGSGSGKTSTMLVGIRDVIRLGRGLVIIDCKGDPKIPVLVANWAERYEREFIHWSIQDPKVPYNGPASGPAYYDPISRGDASRRKDLLVGSQRWDVEYYKSVVANYLQTAFSVMDLVPALDGVDTFSDLADLLNPNKLQSRAYNIDAMAQPELTYAIQRVSDLGSQELSGIRGMYDRIQTLTSSTAGAWLRKDPTGLRDINLKRVADEGQVVVFSLDSSSYEDTVNLIAGLIIQDLKTLSAELRLEPASCPLHIYIDEFSAIDTVNLLGLLSKARDAKMPVTLATQALADLERKESTFVEQVLGIVSSFIIHRANTESDARIYAGLSGVVKKRVERIGVEQSSGVFGTFGSTSATGTGYSEERDDYAVSVGTFQHLKQGYCIFIAKSPVARYVNPVEVIQENENLANLKADPRVEAEHQFRQHKDVVNRITYPHPAKVEAIRFPPKTLGQEVEIEDGLEPDSNIPKRPKMATGKTSGIGKEAGAPVPMPLLKKDSTLSQPSRSPMPKVGEITPIEGPSIHASSHMPPHSSPGSDHSSNDWMMP